MPPASRVASTRRLAVSPSYRSRAPFAAMRSSVAASSGCTSVEAAGMRMRHGQRERQGHRRIGRVAAALEDVQADIGRVRRDGGEGGVGGDGLGAGGCSLREQNAECRMQNAEDDGAKPFCFLL